MISAGWKSSAALPLKISEAAAFVYQFHKEPEKEIENGDCEKHAQYQNTSGFSGGPG
jgi:hypothetical protein